MYLFHLIVDKYHVGTSDRELIGLVVRSRPGGFWQFRQHGRADRHTFLRGCLAAHHENQALYRAVMRGEL